MPTDVEAELRFICEFNSVVTVNIGSLPKTKVLAHSLSGLCVGKNLCANGEGSKTQ